MNPIWPFAQQSRLSYETAWRALVGPDPRGMGIGLTIRKDNLRSRIGRMQHG
jgi:hypothetical protein